MSQQTVPPPASAGQPWSFLLLVLAAAFGVVGNTRIGWPVSGEHILAWCLLILAVALMLMAVFLRQFPPLLLPVSMLVVAMVIVQRMPEVGTGVQVVPNLPWRYSGWIPVVLSAAAWFFLLLAILTSGALDAAEVTPLFLLWMLAFTLPLSFWGGEEVPAAPAQWEQMAELRMKEAAGERLLADLQSDKDRLVEHLRRLGVRSSADLKETPAARPLAQELAEVVQQIGLVQKRNEKLGSAIADIESKLRRIGRREIIGEVGLSGEEEKDLIRRGLELEEEVGEVSPLEVERIADEMLSE